jgi:hypothetical protein
LSESAKTCEKLRVWHLPFQDRLIVLKSLFHVDLSEPLLAKMQIESQKIASKVGQKNYVDKKVGQPIIILYNI